MSGRWTRLWNEERQEWVDVYIELPDAPIRGVGSFYPAEVARPPDLLGPDGKPMRRPLPHRIGFRRP